MANPMDTATREVAKELYLQGVELSQIADTTGAKRDTIRKWAERFSWTAQRKAVAIILQKAVSPQVRALTQQGDRAKQLLADELDTALKTFAKAPPLTVHELLDNEGRKARIDGLKALADIGVIAHGWGKDAGANGLVGYARVSESFIDVESSPEIVVDQPVNNVVDPLQVVATKPDDATSQ